MFDVLLSALNPISSTSSPFRAITCFIPSPLHNGFPRSMEVPRAIFNNTVNILITNEDVSRALDDTFHVMSAARQSVSKSYHGEDTVRMWTGEVKKQQQK